MSNPIEFRANVTDLQAGDDEIRIVLALSEAPADRAAALTMMAMRNRSLHVSAYLGADDEETLAEFRGSISQIKNGIQFRANKPPLIRLDIPASDGLIAAKLVGYDELPLHFEIEDEGDRPAKKPKEKKPPKPKAKTPFGDMWQELLHRNMGFEFIPVVAAELEKVRSSPKEDAHLLMRKLFRVDKLSNLIGPDEIRARFPHKDVTGMVRQALDKVEEQTKAPTNDTASAASPWLHAHDEYDPGFDPYMH
jgi:hypothetical protein